MPRNRKRKTPYMPRYQKRKMGSPNPRLCFSEFNKEEEEKVDGRRRDYYANRRSVEENQDMQIIDIEDEDDDFDLQLALFHSSLSCWRNESPKEDVKKKGIVEQSLIHVHRKWVHNQVGESSYAHCVICNDTKSSGSILRSNTCGHPFCQDCIRNYIKDKLQDDHINLVIECPEAKCKQVLEERFWLQFIPERLTWILEHALIEASVLAMPQVFTCPFEDCLEPIVDDERNFLIRACPNCWKIFCRHCMVSWHEGMTCYEFRRLKRRQQTLRLVAEGGGQGQLFVYVG